MPTNPSAAPSPFSQLVIMIASSALQQLGQLPDPNGQRPEVNLEAAQGMIDILEMLDAKTKGNLDDAEAKMLQESLTMLRLQFVEIKQATQRGETPPPAPAPEEPAEPPAAEGEFTAPPPNPDNNGERKTRFRKSYG